MLPQRVRHSHIQIQLLGIERFHFYLYYIGRGSRGGFAESVIDFSIFKYVF